MTDARPAAPRQRLPLHWKMLIGFVVGFAAGMVAHYGVGPDTWWVEGVMKYLTLPVKTIFLNLIFMLIIPLLFSALVIGVSEMGDVRTFGRVGWRTLFYTVLMSALAVILGLVLVNLFQPGAGVNEALALRLLSENAEGARGVVSAAAEQPKGIDMLLAIIPSNIVKAASSNDTILSVMFFALMLGIGLVATRNEATQTLQRGIQGLFDVSMTLIGFVIRLAPYAVACLMFNMAVVFGVELLVQLGAYVGVVVLALALHMFVTYSIALKLNGWSPLAFFRGVQEAMLLAFSTASSNATLPTSLRVADERLRLPRRISRFVLTVGATANQNGTALFEGVTVIFLAQFFGVELTLVQQVTVMFVCILGGIGTAGVPSGSLPVVALICAMVGVPAEGIGLILGVNHFLDMCRTALNVTGDLAIAAIVSKGEVEEPAEAAPQAA